MATEKAGMSAALVVLVFVLGLMTMVGVILLMMWFQPGIEHSPSARRNLSGPGATARISDVSMFADNSGPHSGVQP